MANVNENVYILSLEASEIYNHMVRGKPIEVDYVGMLPDSLQLRKLKSLKDFNISKVKESGKLTSKDVINVKFKYDVGDADTVITACLNKIDEVKGQISQLEEQKECESNDKEKDELDEQISKKDEYISSLKEFIATVQSEKDDKDYKGKWDKVSNDELRKKLYEDGFTIEFIDKKTGEIDSFEYCVFQRSSSKSRTGQCLFIKKSLHEEMKDWSRMRLHSRGLLKGDQDIDLASLLSYEALTGSSIEGVVKIHPKNILLIEDVDSVFPHDANIIKFNEHGDLDSYKQGNATISNSIWDGQSILEASYYPEDKSMMLLRNHMFKSASFACHIQDFLQKHKPKGVRYREWTLHDMLGNPIKAKDVHLITTPNSLKALKFSHVFANGEKAKRQMYDYWKGLVLEEGYTFGIVKSEKESQKGENEQRQTVNQFTYQFLNSLPLDYQDVKDLSEFECKYIMDLKNDDEVFRHFLRKEATDQNAHNMFADLLEINNDITHNKIFRQYRTKEINKYVKHVRKGKVRIVSDYAVMCSNPISMLKKAIDRFDISKDKSELIGNQIHTTMFDEGEVAGFRNPHTSPSNVVLFFNRFSEVISKYMKTGKNIVYVNSIDFPIQDLLSSCDFDSDSVLLTVDPTILKAGKNVFGKYLPCLNHVDSEKNPYQLNNTSMYEIDKQLALSTEYIGTTVNTGQLAMSAYYDSDKSEEMLKQVNIVTVLSTICIDLAKKFYDGLDIEKEIKNIESKLPFNNRTKPIFWKYIRKDKKSKENKGKKNSGTKYVPFDCPMDHLQKVLDNELVQGDSRENVDMYKLLKISNMDKANRRQILKIRTSVSDLNDKIHRVNQMKLDEEEKDRMIEARTKYTNFHLEKMKMNDETMSAVIFQSLKRGENSVTLLRTLHSCFPEIFKNAFINKNT